MGDNPKRPLSIISKPLNKSLLMAIADPPYLGRAHRWYGASAKEKTFNNSHKRSNSDEHPQASQWDDPRTHKALVDLLKDSYDAWAISMVPENLYDYLTFFSPKARPHIAVWHKVNPVPGGGRIGTAWEPVLVWVPPGRRKATPGNVHWDVLKALPGREFVGQKPPEWTQWVLNMLGYRPGLDTVHDLFPGSGAVGNEIARLRYA